MKNNIDAFISCEASYEEADKVIFGAPFDGTTSFRPGTRFAGKAIRSESFGIETYSPYQDKDLEDYKIFDAGDLELCFGNTEKVLEDIENMTTQILKDNKMPVMIGGEHLVTLGAFRAIYKKYNDINIIHFDAHTDLREEYLGEKLSHASVIRRIWDYVGDGKIYQYGIRSGERDEFYWAKKHTYLNKFNFQGLDKTVEELKDKPVYLTIDLDVLDPSEFCGTGTPEAGGVRFMELLEAILKLKKLNIVGFDMVELSPAYDASGASTAIACKILRELLLAFSK
ncbi:agmatinase [Clostridium sp. MSJ-8]|uniref:agmatinase n=1 Tax=Clostridium sp. MSJ-8 TaxID=2841510 RepID=UPI001C0E9D61|nr:agmatinase [Clostridium sp. MSJ-8]MBU5487473.1 agmatinase [Clostridium sp. MSJ-8]